MGLRHRGSGHEDRPERPVHRPRPRGEGLRVYTVFIGGRREEALGSSRALVDACSGTADTPDDDRADFHFEADDPATLRAAFEEIGQRLLAVRRTL